MRKEKDKGVHQLGKGDFKAENRWEAESRLWALLIPYLWKKRPY